MAPSVIQPIFGKNPEFYAMSCPKCGWEETLELDPCEMDVITLDGEAPKGPRSVTELPNRCPECGARLKKEKLPIRVVN
jgi:predicted nucleic-acid-binding Zn-ribbon protein